MATLCFLIEKTGWPLNYIYSLDIDAYQEIIKGFLDLDKIRNGTTKTETPENTVSVDEFKQILNSIK